MLVKDVSRHSNKRRLVVNIFEISTDATGATVTKNMVVLLSVAVAVNGSILVAAASALLWGGRGEHGEGHSCNCERGSHDKCRRVI